MNGTHGGSGGGLFGGSCGKDNGASGAGGSGFVYSNQKPNQINEIKDIEIQNGNLSYGINRGDGFARITLLSPIKLTDYLYNLRIKKINHLTAILKSKSNHSSFCYQISLSLFFGRNCILSWPIFFFNLLLQLNRKHSPALEFLNESNISCDDVTSAKIAQKRLFNIEFAYLCVFEKIWS
ncbi:hypothetical protein TVAG_034400 [Trichomonas vaginalis G3]|uniref:receptor protein-tyrosine kinase n=1 Tax=Trichomonas vaginalis (strain ATCC PRA-98 / G3) TaxID=412133 RepID=A2EM77_TRIV3|nr:glycine-rich protein family [Trichomonas vaginalis G3]EAY06261.1 hypothetical protein TVAG_034400 [Trichomonas vaginalis G3]KAI5505149.1 glycine-rich protein family [Trichomonas vaginalis G3]|eukprot:XP_001318484.1 hypothetical protein [Trichomonas vaginalis G3]